MQITIIDPNVMDWANVTEIQGAYHFAKKNPEISVESQMEQ